MKLGWLLEVCACVFCALSLAAIVAAVLVAHKASEQPRPMPVKRVPVFVPLDWCTPVPIMPPRRGPDIHPTLIDAEIQI